MSTLPGIRDAASLHARLATAVEPGEVYAALSRWCAEQGIPTPAGIYLQGRDGSFHLDPTSATTTGVVPAIPRAPLDGDPRRVSLPFRERVFAVVEFDAGALDPGAREIVRTEFAPALFRALFLDDTRRDAESMRQQLFYLDEMGKLIGRLDLDLLLVNILELTSAHLGAHVGSITLLRRGAMETVVDWGLPHDALARLTLRDGARALDRVIETGRPMLLEQDDLRPDEDSIHNFEHMLLLPLCTSEAVWGSINLVAPSSVDSLDSPQLHAIRSGVGLAATAVENALLFEIKLASEREREQLELGHQIQSALLPSEAPRVPGLDVAGSSVSAAQIGGDYYDYFELPDGRLGLIVADVAGKGVPAGLIMTATRSLFRAATTRGSSPARILEEVNRLLCADGFGSRFVTALFVAIDPVTGDLEWSSAGHDPPLLWRASTGGVEDHPMPALPLGLRPSARYEERRIRLRVEDVMILYTDGVTEAMNAGREQFGGERMARILSAHGTDAGAERIRDAIIAAVDHHCAGSPRHDDTTLIVVRKSRPDGGTT